MIIWLAVRFVANIMCSVCSMGGETVAPTNQRPLPIVSTPGECVRGRQVWGHVSTEQGPFLGRAPLLTWYPCHVGRAPGPGQGVRGLWKINHVFNLPDYVSWHAWEV